MIKFLNLNSEKPYIQFKALYQKALENGQKGIEAISVSSYDKASSEVEARYVNLKYIANNEWIFFSNYLFGQSLDWNHKTIFTTLAWLSYALVLFGRVQFGWRGKKSIIISLLAFAFLILAYLGTKFVVEMVLV